MNEKDRFDMTNYFTNFQGALYQFRNDLKNEKTEREASVEGSSKKDYRSQLENVNLSILDVGPEIEKFKDEFINDLETQKDAVEQLIQLIDDSREMVDSITLEQNEKRHELLDHLESILHHRFSEALSSTPIFKLRLNADKTVVCYLFQQLKNITVDGENKVLSQTNRELAKFLIRYVEGYENLQVQDLTNRFSRKAPKKRRIEVKAVG